MTHASAPALAVVGLEKRYGSVVALAGVSLEVARGACVALVGESGSGKSTLLRCINRMIEPDAGAVLVHGVDVRARDAVALRREIGYVPQDGGLLGHWRVERNAALVPWLRGDPAAASHAREALRLAGLDPERFATRFPRELSGGQRQRVAVARSLAGRPDVLLMDEPFGALDAITRAEMHEMFVSLRDAVPTTVVVVTHDLHEAVKLADRVAVFRRGRIEQVAAPSELRRAPATEYVAQLVRRAGIAA